MDLMDYLQPIGILLLFFVILYAAYFTTKFTAKFQSGRTMGKNMTIVEAISVGPQKTLQIVRVGETYMVVGVSRDQITYLREIDSSELELKQQEEVMPFSKILDKIVRKDSVEQSHIESGEDRDEPIEKK